MRKIFNYSLLGLGILLFFACNSTEKQSEIPVIDVTKSYPKKEIILQDIADVEYIPLETRDEVLLGQYTSIGFASKDKIILYNRKYGNVFCFDGNGKFIQTFNHQGQSGREYLRINKLVYDAVTNELYIYDKKQGGGKLQVYSTTGEYRRSLALDNDMLGKIVNYDNEKLLAYEEYVDVSAFIKDDKTEEKNLLPFFFINKKTGKIDTLRDCRLQDRESKMLFKMDGESGMSVVLFATSNIIPTEKQDSFILDAFAGDTIFEYTKDKKLIPICLKTPSLKQQGEKVTLVDVRNVSADQIFLKLRPKDFGVKYKDYKNLFVNRKTSEIGTFQLKNRDVLSDSLEIDTKKHLLNADVLVDLLEEEKLSGKLKEIAEEMTPDDNPILVRVRLKE